MLVSLLSFLLDGACFQQILFLRVLPAEEGGDLIALLLELKSIKLDTAILQNPTFLTLQDFSVTLIPEPVGRVNPFAPLGDNAPRNTPVSTTTTATTTTQ